MQPPEVVEKHCLQLCSGAERAKIPIALIPYRTNGILLLFQARSGQEVQYSIKRYKLCFKTMLRMNFTRKLPSDVVRIIENDWSCRGPRSSAFCSALARRIKTLLISTSCAKGHRGDPSKTLYKTCRISRVPHVRFRMRTRTLLKRYHLCFKRMLQMDFGGIALAGTLKSSNIPIGKHRFPGEGEISSSALEPL